MEICFEAKTAERIKDLFLEMNNLIEENIIKIGYKGISKNTKKFIKNYAPLVKTKQNIHFTEGTKLMSIKNF